MSRPDQYPDRFDQLVNSVGANEVSESRSGTLRPRSAEANDKRVSM